jgi:hypothetical protein
MTNSRRVADAFPVQCCFCGEMIAGEPPLDIVLRLPQDSHQNLFAHGNCFKSKLHASVPFLTPAEFEEDA